MNSRLPTSNEPSGHESPFERQNITESACSAHGRGGDALLNRRVENPRAVKMDGQAPFVGHMRTADSEAPSGTTRPPLRLCVFSRHSKRGIG